MSDWVKIVHPVTGGIGEVHRSSLPQHYAAGWRLLTGDEAAALEPGAPPEPPPMTREQAAEAAQATENELKEM